jgi:dihydroneopterin aldolase
MDTVYIKGLRVDTVIGVYDWERDIRQTVLLDLDMDSDNRRAAAGDSIELALDYAAISEAILGFVGASEYQLIETLAEEVATLVLRDFNVRWLRLRVSKPGAVAQADDVGVVIERGERA